MPERRRCHICRADTEYVAGCGHAAHREDCSVVMQDGGLLCQECADEAAGLYEAWQRQQKGGTES